MRDELADAIACTLLQQIEEYQQYAKGIPVGDTGLAIDDIQYEEGEDTIGIRLTDGTTWELRPQQVFPTPPTSKSWGHMTPDERTERIRANVRDNTRSLGRHSDALDRVPSSELIERLARERVSN